MESEKGKQPSKGETLAEINKYHLMFAGYSAADIIEFGELGKLTKERMWDLLRRKILDEAAKSFEKAGIKTRPFDKPDEK